MYGSTLDVNKEFRRRFGFKAPKQHIKISHTPSTIDENQDLHVKIPNRGINDVIVPDSLKLTFDLELTSSVNTRYAVNNIGKALITKLTISFEGNEIQSIQNFDIWQTFNDRWLTPSERAHLIEQGIDDEGNINKIRLKAHNAEAAASIEEKAIARAYGSKFCIPISSYFEMTKYLPFVGVDDRLSFVLHFASYAQVIKDAGSGSGGTAKPADGTYKISNIALEFDKIEDVNFAKSVRHILSNLSLPYDRVLRLRVEPLKKSDTMWNIQVNTPSESFKAVCLLFIDPSKRKPYAVDNEDFYNPLISKVSVTVEGEPNQLYSHGMLPKDMYSEAFNYFVKSPDTGVTISNYFTTTYGLLIDFRSTRDNLLHGTGRKLKNLSDGITLHIEKKTDGNGDIQCYIFVLQDGQVNFQNGRFHSVGY